MIKCLLFSTFFNNCEVSVADLFANLVLNAQFHWFSSWFAVGKICTYTHIELPYQGCANSQQFIA